MSNCCCSGKCEVQPRGGENTLCPDCGRRGWSVGHQTLTHVLKEPLVAELGGEDYHFCSTPDCDTVYFSAASQQVFRRSNLKVRAGIKETEDPVPVCYCFGHTRASLWEEIERTGRSTVLNSIKREVKAGRCECETKNPSGKCCLGDVTRAVQDKWKRAGRG